MQAIAKALPAAALSDTVRSVLSSQPFPTGQLAVLVAWAVLAPLAAARWFRWESEYMLMRLRPPALHHGVAIPAADLRLAQIGRMSRLCRRSSIAGCSALRLVSPYTRPRTTPCASMNTVWGCRARRSAARPARSGRRAARERDLQPLHEVGRVGREVAEVHADHLQPAAVVGGELLEHGQLLLARMAPRREEHEHDGMPAQRRELHRRPVVDFRREVGRGRADLGLAGVDGRTAGVTPVADGDPVCRVVREDQCEQTGRDRDRQEDQQRDRGARRRSGAGVARRAIG